MPQKLPKKTSIPSFKKTLNPHLLLSSLGYYRYRRFPHPHCPNIEVQSFINISFTRKRTKSLAVIHWTHRAGLGIVQSTGNASIVGCMLD
ncbi:hypothetical protein Hypma_011018 [Hypsizygus marmoreus]|uniref:Uncharacterized protein n=1 Tax=Hypsizygus marmoreus TaxID=39966 RepID=A0A369JHZ0_HYPMA|nr:hypothetical protein Hypma_011018 [Hypsizygus marmoreus]